MKKVSSGTQLSEMTSNRQHFSTAPSISFQVKKKPTLHKSSSEESLQKTQAYLSEISPPPEPVSNTQEIMYAVVSKGLAASECLVDFEELEPAPGIHLNDKKVGDLAACMATPVIPDVGNGEIVTGRAAELQAESAKNVTLRYAKEIANSASDVTRRLSRRLSRKRSMDDGQLTHLVGAEQEAASNPRKKVADIPHEAKELLNANLVECSEKNKLSLD